MHPSCFLIGLLITSAVSLSSNQTETEAKNPPDFNFYRDCDVAIQDLPLDPPGKELPVQFDRDIERDPYWLPASTNYLTCYIFVLFRRGVVTEWSSWLEIRAQLDEMNGYCLDEGLYELKEYAGEADGIDLWLLKPRRSSNRTLPMLNSHGRNISITKTAPNVRN